MVCGTLSCVPTTTYPDDCIQSLCGSWWEDTGNRSLCRGRLAHAFVPYIKEVPLALRPERAADPGDHHRAVVKVEPLNIDQQRTAPNLPVAALPFRSGEHYAVYSGKVRPVVLLFELPDVPQQAKGSGSIFSRTMVVAPFFGGDQTGVRAGASEEMLERIRHCEYSRYMWDRLPTGGAVDNSILKWDHLLPIGSNNMTFKPTQYCLSKEALKVFEEWLIWLQTGQVKAGGVLETARQFFADP